jgi:hypothetical protein
MDEIKQLNEAEITELIKTTVESKKASPIRERDKDMFERLLMNEINYLKEQTFAGDIAGLGQVLIPVFRRAFPILIGKDIVGIQPLSQPIGYVFAARYYYAGNKAANTTTGYTPVGGAKKSSLDYETSYQNTSVDFQRTAVNTCILVWATTAARIADGVSTVGYGEASAICTGEVNSIAATAYVLYSEDNKAVIYASAADIVLLKAAVGTNTGFDATDYYDNEASYLAILKNYAGPLTTLIGEQKGNDNKIDEIGYTIDKISVEAKTRKLKARYTIESAQDLKSVHGKDMATELVDILTHEIAQSIDRDIIDTMNAVAPASTFDVNAGDGRWQAERFKVAYTEVVRKANEIAKSTMRGPGNVVVCDADVATMFEQMPGFTIAPVGGNVNTAEPVNVTAQTMIGNVAGRFNIYRDIFASTKYATIGYKGPSNYDCGIIWAPYIPVEMKKVVEPESANPAIIFMERSALVPNIFGASNYYRKITFSNIF